MQACLWTIPSLAESTSPFEQLAEAGLPPLICPTTETQFTKGEKEEQILSLHTTIMLSNNAYTEALLHFI
jgi:hypothetical protein